MEINFIAPDINMKSKFDKFLSSKNSQDELSAFGTYFVWSECYGTKIHMDEKFALIKTDKEDLNYCFPVGKLSDEELKKAIHYMMKDCKNNNRGEFKISRLNKEDVESLKRIMPGKFEINETRDRFEYIYNSEDLANLKGKKYHGKRNHISKFKNLYDWSYEKIIPERKEIYLKFFEKWFEKNSEKEGKDFIEEFKAIKKSFENYEKLEFEGGAILVDGQIVACTIGEKINHENFVVHFEKAFTEFEGAYTIVNQEFSKTLEKRFKFINREEDLGIEGLRKAKLSYKPFLLLEKYDAFRKIS